MTIVPSPAPRRRGFLAAGGWVVVLAIALSLSLFSWRALTLIRQHRGTIRGDGATPSSYGFPLRGAAVPAEDIVASGAVKDGVRALDLPVTWSAAEIAERWGGQRGKFLVPGDRVAGIVLGDEARAYPLRLLAWHEVVNDVVGGAPVAVVYSPLSDTVAAFDRRVDGEARTFGVSGLLWNSTTLLYDRRDTPNEESLWGLLPPRPLAGPALAAGHGLTLLPVTLTTWDRWQHNHPETRVLAPDPAMRQQYRRAAYSSYLGSDLLRFPVRPLPPPHTVPFKTPVVVIPDNSRYYAFTHPALLARASQDGTVEMDLDGRLWRFRVAERPAVIEVVAPDGTVPPVLHTFFFAWYACQPAATRWIGFPSS